MKTFLEEKIKKNQYRLGKVFHAWNEMEAQTITFIITEDCNLRCKYCYITHKTSNNKMSFETAKQFIDYIFSGEISTTKAVVLEFIGGEPFLEVDLIDKISDYFKITAFEKNHDWYWNYRINICTNGVNYSDDRVQDFLKKNMGKLSVSITLDGIKEKHDLQRVFPNGKGSYDIIKENIPKWISQFIGATKVTFASEDLKYLKDSIIALWNDGITHVASNVVFEDVWKEGDDLILEEQLKQLADYALDNMLFDKCYCSFFNEKLGGYYDSKDLNKTSCGAGKMMAIGPNGNIYPCIRYKDYSLNNKKEWAIGTVEEGIDMEKVRPFITAMVKLQSDEECISCEVAKGCSFCQGFNYDQALTPTNFSRAKFICKMHKARVRANDYYFSKLFNCYGIEKEGYKQEGKSLYFLLSDDYVSYCQYENKSMAVNKMNNNNIIDGLKYARKNFYSPIFIHSNESFDFTNLKEYNDYRILHIIPAKFYKEASKLKECIFVFNKNNLDLPISGLTKCIFNIDSKDINNLFFYICKLFSITNNLQVNILNLNKDFNEIEYKNQLEKVKQYIIYRYNNEGIKKEINLLTDLCNLNKHNNCKAGDHHFTYAPNGKIYICSSYYSSGEDNSIGNISEGLINFNNSHLYKLKYNALCNLCDAYQCKNCIYINESATKEVNVSPSYQCRKSFIEREMSRQYQVEINCSSVNLITPMAYQDPMSIFLDNVSALTGYYKF